MKQVQYNSPVCAGAREKDEMEKNILCTNFYGGSAFDPRAALGSSRTGNQIGENCRSVPGGDPD
jgi:hypothetical protein